MNNSILFVAVIFLFSLLIPVDLDARAGGGGSYRSSGSSSRSSYSSSSSSSYRSSSSSSYRSSSSSSSYRSSSSSSGSSSSSYRSAGPSYVAIDDFKSVERVLNFHAPGKLVLREKLTAKIPGLSDEPGYELDFSGPQEPWKIDSVRETTGVFDSVRDAHHSILTGPKKNAAGTKQLEFFSMASYAATPTLSGSTLVFTSNALCLNAAKCKIELSGLSPLDRVELSYLDATKGIKEVTTKNFDNVSLQGVYALTIRFAGNHHKSAAQAAWQKAECQFETETHLRIDSSGILSHSENILNPKDASFICYTLHLSFSTEQFLLKNVMHLLYADSSPLKLRLSGNIREFGYEALGAIASGSADAAELTIHLPALYSPTDNYPQRSARNITTRKHIFVQTPPGVVASFKLFACENSKKWEPPCKTVRPLSFHESRQDNRITLTPDEAQTQKTWLLIGSIQKGAFASPNILTKLQFAFGNYHTIGYYPRWVFFFYFSSIVVGILLAIFIFRYLALRKRRILSQNVENARQTNAERIEDFVVRKIQKHDPAFDIEAFKARGRTIAEKIQTAWCAGDMSSCRRYLSQGVYNRFRTQLKIMREIEKKQNAMADFHIRAFSLSAYVRSGPYDAIAVRLDAKARDTMLDATINPTDALAMAQRAPLTRFTEYYTFMRRHDAQTTQKENADACSHCGTPFAPEGELTKCKSCGAVEGSGTFDWVLAEITQEVEYSGLTSRKDIAEPWSADRIEDRASYVFWRDVLAKCTGDAQVLQRDATTQYLEKGIQKQPLYQAAVGAADLKRLKERDGVLYASVRIKWSAAKNPKAEPTHAESILTLAAKREAAEATTFADPGCASCGAPLPESDSATCAYCHAPVTKKNADWLLVDVQNGE